MAEYIEKEAAIKTLREIENLYRQTMVSSVRADMAGHCRNAITRLPAANVRKNLTGEWELFGNDDDVGSSYFCTRCHHSYDESLFYPEHGGFYPYNFCPNCGAHMTGGNDA